MRDNQLVDYSKKFAVEIFHLCNTIRENKKGNALVNQLLRCGTSIGANIHEANYASGRADFINKLHIALKECYETEYWLELLNRTGYIADERYQKILNACGAIRRMLISSINTVKKNNGPDKE